MSLRRLGGWQELVAASGGDPFVRWHAAPRPPLDAWADPVAGVVAFTRPSHRWGRSLAVIGPPEAALPVAARLLELHDLAAAAVSRAADHDDPHTAEVPSALGMAGFTRLDHWDWMWTDAPSPAPVAGEERVEPLVDAEAPAVERLLASAGPRHSVDPGDPVVRGWVGVRDAGTGRLLACAAHEEPIPGVPQLASVATAPDARGQGLGTAVTAALTRRLFASGTPVVTLALDAGNHRARRIYRRLGYRRAARLTTYVRS